jgi:hypothetical protein
MARASRTASTICRSAWKAASVPGKRSGSPRARARLPSTASTVTMDIALRRLMPQTVTGRRIVQFQPSAALRARTWSSCA